MPKTYNKTYNCFTTQSVSMKTKTISLHLYNSLDTMKTNVLHSTNNLNLKVFRPS